jgi:hypothetical protein
MMNMLKKAFMVGVYVFAFIGVFFTLGYVAIRLHLTNVSGTNNKIIPAPVKLTASSTPQWTHNEEWVALKSAIAADKPTLDKAANDTGIPARLIVSQLVVEQLRLFTSSREIFKEVFEPLKILGIQSQYSWGVMGIKQDTAIQIEKNATDTSLLKYYSTKDSVDTERFNRLTDEHNHYWSYVYAALYLKQIEQQWQKAGFDISHNVGVLSTLYNIGYAHSKPNSTPEVGGAVIDIYGTNYSFGSLAESFYNSDELIDLFPRN